LEVSSWGGNEKEVICGAEEAMRIVRTQRLAAAIRDGRLITGRGSFVRFQSSSLHIPSLLIALESPLTSSEVRIQTLKTLGKITEKEPREMIFIAGGLLSLRHLLNHEDQVIQEEVALCLFKLTTSSHVKVINSLEPTPFIRCHVNYQHPLLTDGISAFSFADYRSLLSPLLNRITSDNEDFNSHTIAASALFTILSNYPSLSEDLLQINVIDRLLPLFHPIEKSQVDGSLLFSFLLNILKIFTLLSQSKLFLQHCPGQCIEHVVRGLREIVLNSANSCEAPLCEQYPIETQVRLHAALCLENLASTEDLIPILHEQRVLQALVRVFTLWPDIILLRGIWPMMKYQKSSIILFDEGAHDILLQALLSGDETCRELICAELNSRLTAEAIKLKTPLFEIVTSDKWMNALTRNLEIGSLKQSQSIVESLINIVNTNYSSQKLILSHGTMVITLRLLKASLDVIRNKESLQDSQLIKEIRTSTLESITLFYRSLCLLLLIIASHPDSHGYLYILGGADLLMDVFLDPDVDFIGKKHAAISLSHLISNPQLALHIRTLYTPSTLFPPAGEEDSDSLGLSDILAAEAAKRREAFDPKVYDVDHGIIFALRSFLENEVYAWK
jgi:hypothetical protein